MIGGLTDRDWDDLTEGYKETDAHVFQFLPKEDREDKIINMHLDGAGETEIANKFKMKISEVVAFLDDRGML